MSVGPKDVDREIAAQLQRGDAAAIGRLYDQYGRQAYGLALRILNDRGAAEDVVQEAFLGVWRAGGSYDTSRGSIRNWLLSVVHNRAIDRVRGTAKIRTETHLGAVERRAGVPDAWEALSLDLERRQIQEAFAELPQAPRRTPQPAHLRGHTHGDGSPPRDGACGT